MNTVSLLLLLLMEPMLVPSQYLGLRHHNGRKRMFLIGVSGRYGAYDYVDNEGYLTGFNHNLIETVCLAANIDCRTIWDKTSNTWTSEPGSHPSGGRAIHGRWYDGTAGLDSTRERVHVFQYSMPYTRILNSFFYFKKGSPIDERDMMNKTIGFVRGWASSEKCIAYQDGIANNVMKKEFIKYYKTSADQLEAVKSGEVQAAFADELTYSQDEIDRYLGFERSRPYSCVLSGNSIVTRKDNDFVEYWNTGFMKIRYNGQYNKLCRDAEANHGHRGGIFCLD